MTPTAANKDLALEILNGLLDYSPVTDQGIRVPSSISEQSLAGFSRMGAYYVGRQACWEEVRHFIQSIINKAICIKYGIPIPQNKHENPNPEIP